MIHILLLILRIIGIILLVILGVLLGLILAVLFIPVRYQAEGSYHTAPLLSVRVSWFFRFLSFGARYGTDGFTWSVRVLGIRLRRSRDKDAVQDLADGVETVLGDEEQSLYEELRQDEEDYRRSRESGQESGSKAGHGGSQESGSKTGRGSEEKITREFGRESGGKNAGGTGTTDGENTGAQDTAFSRCRRLADRLIRNIRNKWEKLKFSFKRICDKLKGIGEFTQEKRAWLEDEKNQASLKLLYRQTKGLLLHLWPRKGRCSLTFGFEDPYTTGQVLQAASLIYPFYHRQLSLYPVFDEKILDGEGRISGRIRLSVILWLALQIFFDKHTRRMLKGFLK